GVQTCALPICWAGNRRQRNLLGRRGMRRLIHTNFPLGPLRSLTTECRVTGGFARRCPSGPRSRLDVPRRSRRVQSTGKRPICFSLRHRQSFVAPRVQRRRFARQIHRSSFGANRVVRTPPAGAHPSPHPATLEAVTVGKRRVIPTSVAPITFFVREDADWMIPRREDSEASSVGLSPDAAAVHLYLRQRGASFFADIVRGTGRLKSEV